MSALHTLRCVSVRASLGSASTSTTRTGRSAVASSIHRSRVCAGVRRVARALRTADLTLSARNGKRTGEHLVT